MVLSCTAQNLTCSQEFQPRVPPSSVQLHVTPATAISNATRCLCPFQLWQVVQGTPAQVPPPLLRAQEPGCKHPLRLPRTSPSPLSGVGAVLLNLFVSSTTAGSGVLLLRRRRLVTGVHSVSVSTFTSVGPGRIGQDRVPFEDDPPVRSVSPVSAIEGSGNTSFGGLPLRTRPCPSHGNPLTRFSKETSTR